MKSVGILGTGSYVPEKILTNKDMEKMVDTTDEWIYSRTGIRERRIADDKTKTSDLAVEAAKRALANAGLEPGDIPLIIVATITGDYQFPATSCIVQHKLGIKDVAAFDINAACSGFIYGIETARQFILAGKYDKVLVIGADKMSTVIDWTDRNICVLLGDGAGACILGKTESGISPHQKFWCGDILDTYMEVDGAFADLLILPEKSHFMKMEGREVFKKAVLVMCEACIEILKRCKLQMDDIDWIIPHQANSRIIEAIAERLKISMSKIYTNVERYGNMSAASIPVALDEAIRDGSVKKGQKILLVSIGAGLTWGSSIIQL